MEEFGYIAADNETFAWNLHYIGTTNQLSPPSISRVPSVLRDVSPNSYTPRMVSIGPLHYKNPDLNNQLKYTTVSNLLKLSGSTIEEAAIECLSYVHHIKDAIKSFYGEIDTLPDDDQLKRIMVTDGCFILGFLISEKEKIEEQNDLVTNNILMDMLLLENQIPFFVLKGIFNCTVFKYNESVSLTKLIEPLLIFGHRQLFKRKIKIPNDLADKGDYDHIIGLLHKCYETQQTIPPLETSKIRNAMELEKAGVSVEPNYSDMSWPIAIELDYSRPFPFFWGKLTLKIPDANTEAFVRNIIAYA